MTSGEEAAARGGTTRMRGVEAVHSQSRRGYLVQHGRFDVRMTVVAGLLPAVIVAHQQHDVRRRSSEGDCWAEDQQDEGGYQATHNKQEETEGTEEGLARLLCEQ